MIRALVIANGEIKDYTKLAEKLKDYTFNYVICCDGGVRHLKYLGITPNYIIGDFDSADKSLVEQYNTEECEIEIFGVEKDFSDSELGINKGIELGCEELILIGGTGGRLDHTIANLNLGVLALSQNCNLIIIDEINIVYTMVGTLKLENKKGQTCSILPLTKILEGVTTSGLKYSLKDEDIFLGETRPISNLITEDSASISIKKGLASVILS